MHSKSVSDLRGLAASVDQSDRSRRRKNSFLDRARAAVVTSRNSFSPGDQDVRAPGSARSGMRRLSRRTSFLVESRPVKTLAKLTRR